MRRATRRRLKSLQRPTLVGVIGIGAASLIAAAITADPRDAPASAPEVTLQGAASTPSPPMSPPPMSRPRVSDGALTATADAPAERADPSAGALCPGCDVVLISMCSVRQDYLGPYAGLADTPHIDRVAQGAWRFDRAYAASNFTLSSLTALLTARFPSTTGVTGWDTGLVEDVPILPEILGFYGYRTGAFTIDAASGFRPDYGLDRGFQHMEIIPPPSDTADGRQASGPTGSGLSAVPLARWLADQDTDQPIFAMLHTRTAHFPFVVSPDANDADATGVTAALWADGLREAEEFGDRPMPGMQGGTAQKGTVAPSGPDRIHQTVRAAGEAGLAVWRRLYAESVTRMDADVGVVWRALEARGRLDRTVVVIVADHGESLGDHDEILHGDAYFDTVARVPLIIRLPGRDGPPEGVRALVSHVDIAPTLLEIVGATPPAGADGVSMIPLFDDPTATVRGTALIEGGVTWRASATPRGAVIAPPWALLRQDPRCGVNSMDPPRGPDEPTSCLFHLDDDPDQMNSLARENPAIIESMLARWGAFRAARAGEQVAGEMALDEGFVEMLHRSGYDFEPLQR